MAGQVSEAKEAVQIRYSATLTVTSLCISIRRTTNFWVSMSTANTKETLENDIAVAYNEYLEAYDRLCTCLQKSSISMTKSLLSLKSTERDEIRFALMENQRLALYCTSAPVDGDIKLDLKSILPSKEEKQKGWRKKVDQKENEKENSSVLHSRNQEKDKPGDGEGGRDGSSMESKKSFKVIDPIKLVHGGFAPLTVRESQKDASASIIQIIKVANAKRKVVDLLNKYSSVLT